MTKRRHGRAINKWRFIRNNIRGLSERINLDLEAYREVEIQAVADIEADTEFIINSSFVVCEKNNNNQELQLQLLNKVLDRDYSIDNIQIRVSGNIQLSILEIEHIPNPLILNYNRTIGYYYEQRRFWFRLKGKY